MTPRQLILLLVATFAPAQAVRAGERPGPPIAWQEPGPTARLFLQLPLDVPEPVAAGAVSGVLRLVYANALVVGSSASAAAELDVESAALTAAGRFGLRDDLELFIAVPLLADSGGVLDGAIDFVEAAFDSTNVQRLARPNGVARYRLSGPAGTLERDGRAVRLGDVVLGAKWLVVAASGGWPTTAVRGAVKAPTGAEAAGSGHWDAAAGVLLGWPLGRAALRAALDLTVPGGGPRRTGLDVRLAGSAQVGLAVRLVDGVTGHLQVSAHQSPLDGTGVPQLDRPIYDAVFGIGIPVARAIELQLAAVENFASPRRGADASALVALVGR